MATGTIVLSANAVDENTANGTLIGTLSVNGAADGETFSYSLADSLSDRFEITGNELRVKTGGSLFDFESLNSFLISISATSQATGAGKTVVSDASITINVNDVNEAPTGLTVDGGTIGDKAVAGDVVATLTGIDPDANESFSYILTDASGTSVTSDLFAIVGNQIVLKAGLDQSKVGEHKVWVKVTDHNDLSYLQEVTVTIEDTPESKVGTNKNDRLYGTEGADVISGLKGNDKIFGLGGDDVINGGEGKDMLYGGAGMDTFVFDTRVKKGHFDHIKDFSVADDTIEISMSALSSIKVKMTKSDALGAMKGGKGKGGEDKGGKGKGKDDFGGKKGSEKKSTFKLDKVLKKGKLDDKFFSLADKAKDSTDLFYYNSKNGFLYVDADGSGKGKGIVIAKLDKGLSITADDFLFI